MFLSFAIRVVQVFAGEAQEVYSGRVALRPTRDVFA
jgi:hypothetical protein